jgi:hypothetical protein
VGFAQGRCKSAAEANARDRNESLGRKSPAPAQMQKAKGKAALEQRSSCISVLIEMMLFMIQSLSASS